MRQSAKLPDAAPPVDKSLYARENGWAISGLVALFSATGYEAVLGAAIKADPTLAEDAERSAAGTKAYELKDELVPMLQTLGLSVE